MIECLLVTAYVPFVEQHFSEVWSRDQAAPAGLNFFERDVATEFLQPRNKTNITIVPAGLHIQNPVAELRGRTLVEEVSEQMGRSAMQFGGKLNAADNLQFGAFGQPHGLIVAGERIMVRNAQNPYSGLNRFPDEFSRRARAVRRLRVRM